LSYTDSIANRISYTTNDTLKLKGSIDLAKYFIEVNADSCSFWANRALQLAKQFENTEIDAQVFKDMGQIFFQLENYGRSISYYFEALRIHEKANDTILLISDQFNIALIYDKLGENQKAQDYYMLALKNYNLIYSDSPERVRKFPIGRIYNNLGITYHNFKQYDKALEYYNKAIKVSEETKNDVALSFVYNNIGLVYQETRDYKIALTFFEKALSIKKQQNDREGEALTLSYFAECYSRMGDTGNAIEYNQQALQIANEVKATNLQMVIAGNLINQYANVKNFEKSYEMHLKYKELSDSLDLQKSNQTATMLDMQYKFDKEQRELELANQKRFFWNLTISGLLFVALVVFTLLFFLARSKVKRIDLQRTNLQLERDKLEDDLNYKNKELTTNVMYLVRKNELINSISEKLLNLKGSMAKTEQRPIQEIISELQRSVDDDVWKEFEYRFKDVHEGFYKKLNELYPDLTQNEKKLCAFLRLNMSTKEISAITFQSPHSITIARARLRKKLNLTNQEVNLVEFLSKIE